MHELLQLIPEVSLLLTLPPEELGAKMLFALRQRKGQQVNRMFLLSNLEEELWSSTSAAQSSNHYPGEKREDVSLALTEAWAWLEAQGLLVPAPSDSTVRIGWRVLSRRARLMESEADFAEFKVARLLPKEILHPGIADRV